MLFRDGQIDYGGRRHSRSRSRRLVDHGSVRPLRRAYGIQFALQRNGFQPPHCIRIISALLVCALKPRVVRRYDGIQE